MVDRICWLSGVRAHAEEDLCFIKGLGVAQETRLELCHHIVQLLLSTCHSFDKAAVKRCMFTRQSLRHLVMD